MARWTAMIGVALGMAGCASEAPAPVPPKVSGVPAISKPALASGCQAVQAGECERRCAVGDADSCADLGVMQARGERGAAKDPVAAFANYSKACELRNPRGCRLIAFAYRGGTKVNKDLQAAKTFADRGCSLGDAKACRLFGELTEEAGPPATAWPLAVKAYRRACDGHDVEGCGDLGRMIAYGRGTPAEPAEAFPFLRSACGPDDEPSCAVLASVMLRTTPADPEALKVARASCDRGYGDSCLLAADAAPSEADSFLRRACDLQEVSGCLAVAWKLADANDFAAARPMFMKGCATGDDDACDSLAGLLLGGRMGPRDEAEALRVAKIGCDAGGEKSCDLIKALSRYADPSRKFTASVAGFAFGTTVNEAHGRCTAAHGSWVPVDSGFVCSAQPVRTFAEGTPISLRFCKGKLCEVMAFDRHGVDEGTEVLGKLIDKYGDAGTSEGPSSLTAQRASCESGDQTELRRVWYFRPPNRGETTGRLIFTSTCENALYSVIYQDAAGVQRRIAEFQQVQSNY